MTDDLVKLSVKSSAASNDKINHMEFAVYLQPGVNTSDLDSFVIEEALLKMAADSIPSWVRYIRDTGMKKHL